MNVEKTVLEALLELARVGEKQLVTFNFDNNKMAFDAAVLSKAMCGRMIEILLVVLSNNRPKIEELIKDNV